MPSAPRRRPNQAAATSTSDLATPPRPMKAAAITNSGKAINVEEFSSSAIFCAITTSGCPDTENSTAAQAPSTRKIGMPEASNPKNISRNKAVNMRGFSARRRRSPSSGHRSGTASGGAA